MATAAFMVMGNAAALPAENMLLARYAPARRHGLAFGLKFVLAFGAGPVAVQLVAAVTAWTGDFYWVFAALALVLCGSLAAASRLPGRAGPSLVGASR